MRIVLHRSSFLARFSCCVDAANKNPIPHSLGLEIENFRDLDPGAIVNTQTSDLFCLPIS